MIFNLSVPAKKAAETVASLSAKSGVTYTNGIAGLDAATVSLAAQAISNNAEITYLTTAVYVDNDASGLHRKISIGDQVTLLLDTKNYVFDIIGFNHAALTNASAYGAATATGKAGMTLQMHAVFDTSYGMKTPRSNVGGWKLSDMRTSVMVLMKSYLPTAWQGIIKPVDNVASGGGNPPAGLDTVSDSCFLLSEVEVFGTTTYSVSGEGTQYAYYRAGNSPLKRRDGAEVKDDDLNRWYERSAMYNNEYFYCAVRGDTGKAGNSSAANKRGVSFAFCV